ncbi:EAL domain-containing protein [Conexibacter sp. JD483]|uniref:sensor domain-containing phosphodiesterase n=1 Tax=unclassified Conexibacter TaxID=2627773 RepID=UPI0027270FEE|nr:MULTISPECIES: EAL domain-containing protein [unclassified Conexibacter]MDO8188420.1 EAL domain-containing protein [Conexibacter sp. CPCC 205706]MDO8198207.1 EAL domain-containing protein [Conexibacter sp. CPCC 205762]MDR9370657.1 EAL domain-containing protein [Conexibacter sp. JD483]
MGTIGTEGDEAGLADAGLLVSAVYQPVIELASGGVVGYEALARGPQGGELERPDKLLSAARRAGLLAQVDWECRLAAVSGALDAGLDRSTTLFLNMEPEAVGPSARGDGRTPELWQRAEQALSVAVELPAGALRARPRELVRAADACRDRGWRVVLDDVGADRGSLALLPLVAPDAIKLDLRAARAADAGAPALSDVATAVWAEQERTGAAIVAEGIETERQLEQARGIGATLGQGWLWGRPGALPAERAAASPDVLPQGGIALTGTPFELVSATRPPREGSAAVLAAMSRHLEQLAGGLGAGTIVFASFQEAANMGARVRNRYRQLAADATLVGALGAGLGPAPAVNVVGADLAADDALRQEWTVVVLAPTYAAALVGRDLGDDPLVTPAKERRYRFVLTHDRDLVVAAARSLAARLG